MKNAYWIAGLLGAVAIAVVVVLLVGGEEGGAGAVAAADEGATPSAPVAEAADEQVRTPETDPDRGSPDARPPAEPSAGGVEGASEPAASAGRDGGSAAAAAGSDLAGGEAVSGPRSRTGGSGGEATGAQEPRTAELLRATARAYRDVRSMQADFQQQLHNTLLGRTVSSSGTLYQRQPDRFLMEFSDPAGDLIVSDGSHFWLYFPSTDASQVIRTRRGAQGLDLQSQFIGDPVERFDATYEGTEMERGRRTHVLTLDPRQALGYERLKVWIDDRDHLIRRFELTEGNGIVRRFLLSDLRLDPSLPDRLFQFTPPEGARVVEQG